MDKAKVTQRYYFHVRVDGCPFDDTAGLPLSSDEEAIEVADRIAHDLADEDRDRLYHIRVVNPVGETIAQVESTPPKATTH